ncbi:MAG: protease inhibitor I42 family protein [Chloroflexi bacterium]|nr:protease inhibitor I42 family protein [Chloroflexota bacterium]
MRTSTPPVISTIKVSPTSTEILVLPTANVFINPEEQSGTTVIVSVGDIVAIALPSASPTWQVTFADTIIQSLIPPEHMNQPGEQGWLFRAIAKGDTDVRLTAPAMSCDPGTPCPPAAPITFAFTIEVK